MGKLERRGLMEYKNYEQLKEKIKELEEHILDIEAQVYSLAMKSLPNRRQLKKELLELKQTKAQYITMIDNLTTFDKESFLDFLKRYFPILETNEVVFIPLKKDYRDEKTSWAMRTSLKYFMLDLREEVDVICNKEDREHIIRLFADNDIYSTFKKADIIQGFYLYEEDEEVHLADGFSLRSDFATYPSLEYAFAMLIELGMHYPKLSPQERLDKVIEYIWENEQNNQKRKMELQKK